MQKGKEIYSRMAVMNASADEIESELSDLYYPEDGSPAYEDFLKEQYRQENKKITIDGDLELLDEYCTAFEKKEQSEKIKKEADKIFQKIKMHMVDVEADTMDFGDGFKLTYKGNGLRPSSALKQYIKFGDELDTN